MGANGPSRQCVTPWLPRPVGFVHDDKEFGALIQITSADLRISTSLVEKDYWVTHVLWSLEEQGFEVWFKGGTSLSKGFGLIQRFSEDLDLKLQHPDLEPIENWKSEGKETTAARQTFFDGILRLLSIPGIETTELPEHRSKAYRGIVVAASYPILFPDIPVDLRPFVQLEIGHARVEPCEELPLTSWVHEKLVDLKQMSDYTDNRPAKIRCINPFVTLIEKLDAIAKKFERDRMDAVGFVRHYEDCAHIIEQMEGLALPDGQSVRALAQEMHEEKQIAAMPDPRAPCLRPVDDDKWRELTQASQRIDSWFWGDRPSLADCCTQIVAFIEHEIA